MKKRLFAMLLAIILTISLIPSNTLAASNTEAEQLPEPVDQYENIGIGAGGSFFTPMVDPSNSNNYYATCDMGGLYYSYNKGETWHRTLTRGVLKETFITSDGTIFAGAYGLYVSNDHGKTLEMIYPKDVKHSVSRCGWNENLMLAENFDNGYLVGLTASDEKVWFITVDWSGNLRMMSADHDGNNLVIHHTKALSVSSPMDVEIPMVIDGDRILYVLQNELYSYSVIDETTTLLYRAQGTVTDFKRIGSTYFLLDDTESATLILYTEDFVSWQDLMEKNDLPNTFEKWGQTKSFEWHFKEICGNNINNIFLSFTSDVSDGIMKFDGEHFAWVFDSMYNKRSTFSDLGWGYGCHGPFYGISTDPNDDDFCLVSNIETIYAIRYDGNQRSVRTTHCTDQKDGTCTSTGLDVQTTYSVQEDPFNQDHIIICTTDMGLQISYNNGKSFRRMDIHDGDWDLMNTCYDLYFDTETKDLVYGLWSGRHDAPYNPSLSDKDWMEGAFGISYDGGINWDFSYSSGLPKDCIPVKMSIQKNEDALTIAVATFNRGFFISYDSGKTFTSISEEMDTVDGLIWGEDIVLTDHKVYCLTAPYNCVSGYWEPSILYEYHLDTGETTRIDLGELIMIRSLTYDSEKGLYLNALPNYKYKWFSECNDGSWVNEKGGIYKVDETGVNCIFSNDTGIFHSAFSPEGTLYAVDSYGKIFAGKDGKFELFADDLFIMLKNISFNRAGDLMYVTSFGGGTYRMSIPASESPLVCEHSAELRNAKEATCTEEGYTGDSYCTICGERLEKGSVIPMKDHTYQVVSKEDTTHLEACAVCGNTIELSDAVSIFCWNRHFLNEITYSEMSSFFRELNISRVYQDIPEAYLSRSETYQAVQRFQKDGMEIVALLGDRSWGLEECDLSEVKTYLDLLDTYNQNASEDQKIHKIALDVETHTYSDWKTDKVAYFTTYIEKMREIYEYAHSLNLSVVQIIPVYFDSIDKPLFRQFVETCCDELSLMNYSKSNQISGIKYEIEVCRDLDIPVETIFETMPSDDAYSVDENITYFYDGFEAMQEKRSEILKTYQYSKLSTSYHHFPTVYHVYTGKYLAEIYAYSNSGDPTRDHLGQTEALKTLILEGDDGSRIVAGLYNPNRGAQYEECCYLAIGVKPDVTYTITAGSPEYTVTTGTKVFEFAEGDMIDFTSLRIKRVEPAVCEHSAELRNAKEATCTEEGYTGDSYCTICSEQLEKGSVIPMKDHSYQVVSKEDGTHCEICTVCGKTETAEACTDSNEDQICDFCGYVLPKTIAFKEISVPVNGTEFIITKDGKALSAALESIVFSPVSVTTDQIENSIVWIYDSGYLRCSFGGTEYYLTIDSSNQLSVTTNAAQAAKWTVSSDGISTSVSKKLGFIKYSVTYYLNVSDGEFVLNKRKTSMTLYELIR